MLNTHISSVVDSLVDVVTSSNINLTNPYVRDFLNIICY